MTYQNFLEMGYHIEADWGINNPHFTLKDARYNVYDIDGKVMLKDVTKEEVSEFVSGLNTKKPITMIKLTQDGDVIPVKGYPTPDSYSKLLGVVRTMGGTRDDAWYTVGATEPGNVFFKIAEANLAKDEKKTLKWIDPNCSVVDADIKSPYSDNQMPECYGDVILSKTDGTSFTEDDIKEIRRNVKPEKAFDGSNTNKRLWVICEN